jgi:NADH-quinone oxidoreductase subunit G
MESVNLTIDGKQVSVEKGRTVLQAAIEHDIHIPFYCYHPGLGVDGSCRVCIVKIEKMPKLQTACSTICTEGMVVSTEAPDVVAARASVFEFLLINHPLDCPVCDKGGECPLQDYSYTFGPNRSRMEFPRRVFDGEGLRADVDFGPTIMLNRNRCILCTRCVRFMREIDGDAQIGIVDRGYGSEIATFQEQGVHSLISGNLMDVCPVGALTTRDYRFKSRPWDNPHAVDTICTLCEKGCNTTAWIKAKQEWAKGARLIRITPRLNPEVNSYWMCDIGRFGFHWIDSDQRVRRPFTRGKDGTAEPATWNDALVKVRERIGAAGGKLGFLVSAHASLEEMYLVQQIASALDATVTVSWTSTVKEQPRNTKFPVPPVDAPNVHGAKDLGLVPTDAQSPDLAALQAAVESGSVRAVYVVDPGPDKTLGDVQWLIDARKNGKLPLLIVQGVLMNDLAGVADFILPGATFVEKDATYTNGTGRVQSASQVVVPPGDAMEDWQILLNLAVSLGISAPPYTDSAHVRADLAGDLAANPAYAGMTELTFNRPLPARTWLQASNPSERWKWDFMFQDLPPVKFTGAALAGLRPDIIRLKRVE